MSTQGELSKSAVPPDFGYVRTQKSFYAGYTAMLSHHNGVFAHGSKTGSVFVSQRLAPTAFSLQSPKTYCFLSQLLYLTLVKISQTCKKVNVIRLFWVYVHVAVFYVVKGVFKRVVHLFGNVVCFKK